MRFSLKLKKQFEKNGGKDDIGRHNYKNLD